MPRHHSELRCWKLADELRVEVHAICARPVVQGDFRFCNSFRDACGSVCRNIAEGFARGIRDLSEHTKASTLNFKKSQEQKPTVMVEKTNLMTGKSYMEAEGTPLCCSPASETYWSM